MALIEFIDFHWVSKLTANSNRQRKHCNCLLINGLGVAERNVAVVQLHTFAQERHRKVQTGHNLRLQLHHAKHLHGDVVRPSALPR